MTYKPCEYAIESGTKNGRAMWKCGHPTEASDREFPARHCILHCSDQKTTGEDNPPCQYAEWKMERPCCGDKWLCQNEESDNYGLVLSGKDCQRCDDKIMEK